jgi:phosphonate transport system substrate-binding protein
MKRLSVYTLFLLILLFLLSACKTSTAGNAAMYVDLETLSPLPTPAENEITPLKVAIAAVISPQGSAESYELLLDYLSTELDRPVEAVQRRTYMEVNDLIENGEVDLAFVCTSSYLVGKQDFGMQLLVAPMVHGEASYRANIIIPADSSVKELADLRGKVFAFTDPISFTGRMYPTYQLQQMGETPEQFFKRTFFTYSHDDAINAVADGLADGASVDALILDFALKRDPDLAAKIQIIHTSEPFGIPPVVVGPQIRPQLKAQLEEILLNMHTDSQGLTALQALDYDQFVPISDEAYQSALYIESQFNLVTVEQP